MKKQMFALPDLLLGLEAVVIGGLFLLGFLSAGLVPPQTSTPPAALASHVDKASCQSCHSAESEKWTGSHHDLAIDKADVAHVLGVFDGRSHDAAGERFTFQRDGDAFFVETGDGAEGRTRHEVSHVFGVYPLQQYLIKGHGGRRQVLPVSWDARPAQEGGQKWFDLYPGETFKHAEPLHWSGRFQTWNTMCAECHSTALKRGYDARSDSFKTTWAALDVTCAACHNPQDHPKAGATVEEAGSWMLAEGTVTRHWQGSPRDNAAQIETCAPCHARRSALGDGFGPGDAFLDLFLPSLLEPGLYHLDGQIQEEVYVYGSFLQSKMHSAGVQCSDCHDPHSLQPKFEGNALCAQCHTSEVFDTAQHHRHEAGSQGALCVNCHMPAQTYMGVDDRRDHSLRIPRPDLSARIGAPDACTACHKDKDQDWAIRAYKAFGWAPQADGFGEAMAAASQGLAEAPALLARLVRDESFPAIRRGSAALELGRVGGGDPEAVLNLALAEEEALVRLGAVQGLGALASIQDLKPLIGALDDPLASIRYQAAWVLGPYADTAFAPRDLTRRKEVLEALVGSERTKGERPETQLNIGLLSLYLGDTQAAEAALRRAADPKDAFGPGFVNLAEFLRRSGNEVEAEAILRSGLGGLPDSPELHHALGLALVRQGKATEALDHLEEASTGAPQIGRYSYVYAVALHSGGEPGAALAVVEAALLLHRGDADLSYMAVVAASGAGDEAALGRHAATFVERFSDDPRANAIRQYVR